MCGKPRLSRLEPVKHEVDHRDEDHRLTAIGQRFVVFAQSPVLPEPSERSLDDPALRQDLERILCRTLDDLDRSTDGTSLGPVDKFAAVSAVGPDELHTIEATDDLRQDIDGAIPVLDVGGVNDQRKDEAKGVNEDMSLAPFDFLPRIEPSVAPFSAVLTDWLSMTPAEGVGFFPTLRRTFSRSLS